MKSKYKGFTNGKGFTIVELVIVIAVIGILAAVLIPTFTSVINQAEESKAIQESQNLIKEVNILQPNIDLDDIVILYYETKKTDDFGIEINHTVKYIFEFINREIKIKEYEYFNIDLTLLSLDGKLYHLMNLGTLYNDYPHISVYSKTNGEKNNKYEVIIDRTSDGINNMDFSLVEKEYESGSVVPIKFNNNQTGTLTIYVNDVEVQSLDCENEETFYLTITDTDVIIKAKVCYKIIFEDSSKDYFSENTINNIGSKKYKNGDEVVITSSLTREEINVNETVYVKINDEIFKEIKLDENGFFTFPVLLLVIEDKNIRINVEKIKDENVLCYGDLYPFVNDFKIDNITDINEIIEIKDINYQTSNNGEYRASFVDKNIHYILNFMEHLKLSTFVPVENGIDTDDVKRYSKYLIVTNDEVYEIKYLDSIFMYNGKLYELETTRNIDMETYTTYNVLNEVEISETSDYQVEVINNKQNNKVIDTIDVRNIVFATYESLDVPMVETDIRFEYKDIVYRILDTKLFRNEETKEVFEIVNGFSFREIIKDVLLDENYVTLVDKYPELENLKAEDIKEIREFVDNDDINICKFITLDESNQNSEEVSEYVTSFLDYIKTNKYYYYYSSFAGAADQNDVIIDNDRVDRVTRSKYKLSRESESLYDNILYYQITLKTGEKITIKINDFIELKSWYITDNKLVEMPSEISNKGLCFSKGEEYDGGYIVNHYFDESIQEEQFDVRDIIFKDYFPDIHSIIDMSTLNKVVYNDYTIYITSENEIRIDYCENTYFFKIISSYSLSKYLRNFEKSEVSGTIIDGTFPINIRTTIYQKNYKLTKDEFSTYKSNYNITYTLKTNTEDLGEVFKDNDYIILTEDYYDITVEVKSKKESYDVVRSMTVNGLMTGQAMYAIEALELQNIPTFYEESNKQIAYKFIYSYKDLKAIFDETVVYCAYSIFLELIGENVFKNNVILCRAGYSNMKYLNYSDFKFENMEISLEVKDGMEYTGSDKVFLLDYIIIPKDDLFQNQDMIQYYDKLDIIDKLIDYQDIVSNYLNNQLFIYYKLNNEYILYYVDIITQGKIKKEIICDKEILTEYRILVYNETDGIRNLKDVQDEIGGLDQIMDYLLAVHYSYNLNCKNNLEIE